MYSFHKNIKQHYFSIIDKNKKWFLSTKSEYSMIILK